MDDSQPDQPLKDKPILSYRTPAYDGFVKLASYADAVAADLDAGALAAEGIPAQVFGGNVGALGLIYQGLNSVELHVRADDLPQAAKILAHVSSNELEPADAGPAEDEDGQPLLPAAEFENVRSLYDAQAVLASSSIRSVLPILIPRGDKPAGAGPRFVLRVAQEDLPRAQALLRDEPEDDEPRCPKCGAWRVYEITNLWKSLTATFGLSENPESQSECLACKYVGNTSEFIKSPKL